MINDSSKQTEAAKPDGMDEQLKQKLPELEPGRRRALHRSIMKAFALESKSSAMPEPSMISKHNGIFTLSRFFRLSVVFPVIILITALALVFNGYHFSKSFYSEKKKDRDNDSVVAAAKPTKMTTESTTMTEPVPEPTWIPVAIPSVSDDLTQRLEFLLFMGWQEETNRLANDLQSAGSFILSSVTDRIPMPKKVDKGVSDS